MPKNQSEITTTMPLLDTDGHIKREGWGRYPYWQYDRVAVKAPWYRIKEWDYYYVISDDLNRGITFTISDLGYAGLMALCWIDLENGTTHQVDAIAPLTRGRITGSSEETGVLDFESDKLSLRFHTSGPRANNEPPGDSLAKRSNGAQRKLSFRSPDISGELVLEEPAGLESMNIATSWAENRRRFYYNRKIACMKASGTVHAGDKYVFKPEDSSGGLDWGRGAWTYRNRWFWSSASASVDGVPFGFNLGYGFSDRSPASENALFYDGKAHKLGNVVFRFDAENYTAAWNFTDDEGRLNLDFTPIVDRSSSVNLLLIRSVQHQVFGRFSGTAVLDDGRILSLDGIPGFAEDVLNRW